MSIRISQLMVHSFSVDQARYATSVVENYLYSATTQGKLKFHKTNLPHDMIFTKEYSSTSGAQVVYYIKSEVFTAEVLWDYYFIYYLK